MERFYLELIIFAVLVGGIAITASVLQKHEAKNPEQVMTMAQAQEPPRPVIDEATRQRQQQQEQQWACDNREAELIAIDQMRHQYSGKVIGAFTTDPNTELSETKNNRDTVAYLEEKELKAGDEYLAHPECTKRADEVRKLITDLRAIKTKWGKRS